MQTIKLYDALKRMRTLTNIGVPFSIEFLSFNSTRNTSEGYKQVDKVQLRMGYRDEQSTKANQLIGYVDSTGKNRWFYLPLLVSLNGYKVTT